MVQRQGLWNIWNRIQPVQHISAWLRAYPIYLQICPGRLGFRISSHTDHVSERVPCWRVAVCAGDSQETLDPIGDQMTRERDVSHGSSLDGRHLGDPKVKSSTHYTRLIGPTFMGPTFMDHSYNVGR